MPDPFLLEQYSDNLTATFRDAMNPDDESPVACFVAHDETPWTIFARRKQDLDEAHLNQAPASATTSVRSSPAAVFSSREPSIVTKPTSHGTGYPAVDNNEEGKADIEYAASLSATLGSGSEAEVEYDDALRATLFGTGAWSSSPQAQGQLLRRHEHAKIRLSRALPHRLKKPPVVLYQTRGSSASDRQDTETRTAIPPASNQKAPKCLFHLIPWQHYILFALVSVMLLTVFLSARQLHSMDRAEAKRIVFVATNLVALEALVIALAARRTLFEASLLGLFPLGIGSMLLLHLDDLA